MYSSRARRLVVTSVGPTMDQPCDSVSRRLAASIIDRTYAAAPFAVIRRRTMPRLLLPPVECVYNVRFQRQRLRVLCYRQ